MKHGSAKAEPPARADESLPQERLGIIWVQVCLVQRQELGEADTDRNRTPEMKQRHCICLDFKAGFLRPLIFGQRERDIHTIAALLLVGYLSI